MIGSSNFTSAGLWHLLKVVQEQMGSSAIVTRPFQRLLVDNKNAQVMDRITKNWADTRHELSPGDKGELLNAVRLLANISQSVFSVYRFGFFENVRKERFSAKSAGRYRVAHGKPPYSSFMQYSGTHAFSEAEACVLDLERGTGLMITPLVIWYPCKIHRDQENGHCFLFDKLKGDGDSMVARYKAAGFMCPLEVVPGDSEPSELLASLSQCRSQDPATDRLEGLHFTPLTS